MIIFLIHLRNECCGVRIGIAPLLRVCAQRNQFPNTRLFLCIDQINTRPLLAVGLYQKSRDLEAGQPVSLRRMLFVRAASGGQIWFAGALLCVLMLLWMRAATIIYALFFGLRPFPGLQDIVPMLTETNYGLAMLAVGMAVGGLFAAFSFAISSMKGASPKSSASGSITASRPPGAAAWIRQSFGQ